MLAYKDIFLDIRCIIDVKNLTGKIKVWVRFRIPFYAFQLVAFFGCFWSSSWSFACWCPS